jgi:hypothetical protein
MIKIHELHDLENPIMDMLIETFIKIDDIKILKNYHPEHRNYSGNLFNLLVQGRYSKGKGAYYVLEENKEFITSGGWNQYDFDSEVSLIFTRFYVAPKFRSKFIFTKILFDKIIEQTINYKYVYITVNESNKKFYDLVSKLYIGEKVNLPKVFACFKPIGIKNIYYTPQYVLSLEKEKLCR